jgi:hypothetical protein
MPNDPGDDNWRATCFINGIKWIRNDKSEGIQQWDLVMLISFLDYLRIKKLMITHTTEMCNIGHGIAFWHTYSIP